MTARIVAIAALVSCISIVSGCTAPGEPPSHPSAGDYHDLARRETDKARSAIATMQVVVDELRRQRITRNYATVVSRQSSADVTSVLTDVRQITAPGRPLARAQSRLERLLDGAAATIRSVPPNWNQPSDLRRIARRLSVDSARAERLSSELG
jgi:hypothetical protein